MNTVVRAACVLWHALGLAVFCKNGMSCVAGGNTQEDMRGSAFDA